MPPKSCGRVGTDHHQICHGPAGTGGTGLPGETIDAVRALALIGVGERESVRALLRLTLVKNVNDIPAFEEIFDRFFSSRQLGGMGLDTAELLNAMIHIVEGEQLKAEEHRTKEKDEPLLVVDEEFTDEDLENLWDWKRAKRMPPGPM